MTWNDDFHVPLSNFKVMITLWWKLICKKLAKNDVVGKSDVDKAV